MYPEPVLVLPQHMPLPPGFLEAAGGKEELAELLLRRGVKTVEEVREILYPEVHPLTSPWEFGGAMEEAVERICAAREREEAVCVYGDYDVDGVTATAVLVEALHQMGMKVRPYLPHRHREGYGLHREAVGKLGSSGVKLLVTCDCGSSDGEVVDCARQGGMDVVVTDHHRMGGTPPMNVPIINPHLLQEGHTLRTLSGCGVAFFLVRALAERSGTAIQQEDFLDLVALSIVADAVPLRGESRRLLKRGLGQLVSPHRTGLKALLSSAGGIRRIFSAEDVAFQLVPRLNAAGRLESASSVLELLLTGDRDRAMYLAHYLEGINRERRRLTDISLQEALAELEGGESGRIPIFLCNPFWHPGIIGILAGRLAEAFHMPSFVLTRKGNLLVGSARTAGGVDLFDGVKRCRDILLSCGGHKGACGFSLYPENLSFFRERLETIFREPERRPSPPLLTPDFVLHPSRLTPSLWEICEQAAPFGEEFSEPLFYCPAWEVREEQVMGDGSHLRMVVEKDGHSFPALWWRGAGRIDRRSKIDLAFVLSRDTYRSDTERLLKIIFARGAERETVSLLEPLLLREVVDRRGRTVNDVCEEYPGFPLFQEGDTIYTGRAVYTRLSHPGKADGLLVISPPVSLAFLRDFLKRVRPSVLVLAWGPEELEKDSLVRRLLGMVKFALSRRRGFFDTQAAASACAVPLSLVHAVLTLFEAQGMVTVGERTGWEWMLREGGRRNPYWLTRAHRDVVELLEHRNYLIRFLTDIPLERLRRFLET